MVACEEVLDDFGLALNATQKRNLFRCLDPDTVGVVLIEGDSQSNAMEHLISTNQSLIKQNESFVLNIIFPCRLSIETKRRHESIVVETKIGRPVAIACASPCIGWSNITHAKVIILIYCSVIDDAVKIKGATGKTQCAALDHTRPSLGC